MQYLRQCERTRQMRSYRDLNRAVLTSPLALSVIFVAILFGLILWFLVTAFSDRRKVFRDVVRPTAQWVQSFDRQHRRLPTKEELGFFAQTNHLSRGVWMYDSTLRWPEVADHRWNEGVDFVIASSTKDLALFYNSWDQREWTYWRNKPWPWSD